MPYTPPSQRSPAASASNSPTLSRRSSYQPGQLEASRHHTSRPDLPRSASYLTRHRRTPSVKTTSFAPTPTSEPTPPGTAESENHESTIKTSGSLRQSPPPVTDEKAMPNGAVLSPPESTQNSSDDEDAEKSRGRDAETLAELQASLQIIGQHRESSPHRRAEDIAKANQALTLIMPTSKGLETDSTVEQVERSLSQVRKIAHSRSNTDSSVYIDFARQAETPVSGSEEDEGSDVDEDDRSRRKPPMLRKKSGELVRPALRPSSARRRPSSMPGTPTFSKAVHFDSHLEHVRHFLQVDRPLAVSAGSSPVEAYDSDTEFPFNNDDQSSRGPPFEWEISVSNFPADSPERNRLPIRVERVFLSADNKTLIGTVVVANLSFHKWVVARFTLDYWKTTSEVVAEYNNDVRRKGQGDGLDRFNFNIKLADQANLEAKTMFFCVKYAVNGQEYWDNNSNTNFQVDFKKKPKLQNGKKGMPGAASRPANGLPRSHKKPVGRQPVMPTTFDDFADGFDSKYDFNTFAKQPVNDFLGESGPIRLKGVKSAVSLASDNLKRRAPNPNGQALANRYDFGASLSAAIETANRVLGDRSGITMKNSPKKPVTQQVAPSPSITNGATAIAPAPPLVAVASASGTDSPRPAGTEKPVLASQSYNELLDKYCFFGSVKSSPQLKDGTAGSRPGQYDGNDDTGYIVRSQSPSPNSNSTVSPEDSPLEMRPSKSRTASARSASPAPMTGFVTGTSPSMYPYHQMHSGFPFNEAHTPTAIRG